jgi:hypothetical protein
MSPARKISNSKENKNTAFSAYPTNTYSMKMGNSGALNSLIGYPDVEEDRFHGGDTVCWGIQNREKQAKSESDKHWSLMDLS